jgi:hypothetical protein
MKQRSAYTQERLAELRKEYGLRRLCKKIKLVPRIKGPWKRP